MLRKKATRCAVWNWGSAAIWAEDHWLCVCVRWGECLSVCVDKFLELVTVLVFVACGLWFELVVML